MMFWIHLFLLKHHTTERSTVSGNTGLVTEFSPTKRPLQPVAQSEGRNTLSSSSPSCSPSPSSSSSLNRASDGQGDLQNQGTNPAAANHTTQGGQVIITETTNRSTGSNTTNSSTTRMTSTTATGGYVVLVLIILMIMVLCVVLFLLRRRSRSYSFDLQRTGQVNLTSDNETENIGTFLPVHLDDLDGPGPIEHVTSVDLSPSPVANGTSPSGEQGFTGENVPDRQADGDGLGVGIGLETPPSKNVSFSLDIDLTDKKSDQSGSSTSFFDTLGDEQQNGNNNNPCVCPSGCFFEINLDEPVWSDHLLTPPGPPSSLLPLPPSTISSSSLQLH
ncbi:uncharacterized protein ACJ7VT_012508 isoform 2-T2 [Polymixia lowei]